MFCCPFEIILLSTDVKKMVLSIAAFCIRTCLRSLTFQKIIVLIFLFEVDWSFWIASMRDFNGVIVILSIICPRTFSRVRKKCDLSEAAFMFSCSNIWWCFSTTVKILSFVCDCKKNRLKMWLHFYWVLVVWKLYS